MIVVVSGQTRKCGKTTVMCDLIAATREEGWVAVKLTAHRHAKTQAGDTGRYLAAGAKRAFLLHDKAELPNVPRLIVESNALAQDTTPDLLVYVRNALSSDSKPSADGLLSKANVVVEGGTLTAEQIELLRKAVLDNRSAVPAMEY